MRIESLSGSQKGMTLIEVVVVTAIVGLLTTALGSISYSTLRHTQSNNARMTAVSEIQETARWITNDGQRSQNIINLGDDSLVLGWIDPVSGESYRITYSLSGNNLQRSESIDDGAPTARPVARHVTDLSFSQPVDEERLFKVSLTSSGGSARVSETEEYHVTLRAIY